MSEFFFMKKTWFKVLLNITILLLIPILLLGIAYYYLFGESQHEYQERTLKKLCLNKEKHECNPSHCFWDNETNICSIKKLCGARSQQSCGEGCIWAPHEVTPTGISGMCLIKDLL